MHKAHIAQVDKVEPIPGADNIQVAYVLGERVIVSKNVQEGFLGVLFPEGLQLSHDYCHFNNLYRQSMNNRDLNKKGFFDDNRRVRAQKFMKVQSDAYFAEIETLSFTGYALSKLKKGTQFDQLNKIEICRKYISPRTKSSTAGTQNQKKAKVETPLFHEHVDTNQFKHYLDKIPLGATLSFHAKQHGTSARYTNTKVRRAIQNPLDKLSNKKFKKLINNPLGKELYSLFSSACNKLTKMKGHSWEYVAGTRRVVLRQEHINKVGFNGPEKWRFDWLEKLKPYLDKGTTVYGEIVGWANGSLIMGSHDVSKLQDKRYTQKYQGSHNYTYGVPEGENDFIIYRVTITGESGQEIDLTVDQLKHWCESRGFKHTLEVAPRLVYTGDKDHLSALVENLTERPEVLTEDFIDPSHISEGIVIRVDHKDITPKFYKNKSWAFKVLEGIWKEDNVDIEDADSVSDQG